MSCRILLAVVVALVVCAPARGAELVTIDTPSRHVDPAQVEFNGADHPRVLRANVLLPDGYDGSRRFPVLFLLHGLGDSFATWAGPSGQVSEIARGFPAIVVMPEAARGFYSSWWNDGRRGEPGWERFFLDELVPLVEERFRVLPGRRWHAVAGLSMGGMGSTFLASQLPGYFGSVATFSGFVGHQRPEIPAGLRAYGGVDYERIFGPVDGFYATGHNPARLTDNLRWTRLFVTVGDGTPAPGVESSPPAIAGGGVAEAELRAQNDEMVAAARASGVDVDYRPKQGVHDWPYWRAALRETIAWDPFAAVPEAPASWTYRTVAQSGEAWGLRYRFEEPPDAVVTLAQDGGRVRGDGRGRVEVRNSGGCGFTTTLPFDRPLPPETCPLQLAVSPSRAVRGRRTRFRFLVTFEGEPVAGARVFLGRTTARTGADGRATIRFALRGRAPLRRPSAWVPGRQPGRATIRVVRQRRTRAS
ncbi:MAG TPA: alpha/beta hydrolase family protein [Solirubrobacteraceae bacterium]|nr:alpha/beta hydrolase family protein [Solirubrobacteraceae bacterium]